MLYIIFFCFISFFTLIRPPQKKIYLYYVLMHNLFFLRSFKFDLLLGKDKIKLTCLGEYERNDVCSVTNTCFYKSVRDVLLLIQISRFKEWVYKRKIERPRDSRRRLKESFHLFLYFSHMKLFESLSYVLAYFLKILKASQDMFYNG